MRNTIRIWNILYKKYLPIINKKSKTTFKYVKNKGLELEDITQEILLSFERSIKNYNEEKNGLFYTFTNLCIDRTIISIIRNVNRDKHKYLNESVPIETLDDNLNLIGALDNKEFNPEEEYSNYENYIELYKNITNSLTNFEECVFTLKVKGFNYEEISILLDKDLKSINNAMHRIRVKINKLYV